MKVSGNELLVETLAAFGVSTLFTLHGGHLDGVYRAALDRAMSLIDTRHEQAAGFAAQGYAKATGAVGIAFATAGGGVSNLATPVANAAADAVPVVFFGAAPPLRDFDSLPVNSGFDQVALMTGVAKWAHRATVTEMLPQVVARAFQIAREGRPGPVYIDLPTDVLFAQVEREHIVIPAADPRPAAPAPDADTVVNVVRMLEEARRPVVLAGGGAVYPDASQNVRRLAERYALTVLTNNKSKGIVPTPGDYAGGSFGAIGAVTRRTALEPDLILVLGARFGLYTGGRRGSVVPDSATVVHVDIEAEEFGRIRDTDIGVVASVDSFVSAVLRAGSHSEPSIERKAWLAEFIAKKPERGTGVDECASLLRPSELGELIASAVPDDTTFVLDGGETPAWLDPLARVLEPRRWVGHGYLGVMGEGLPHAIGVQTARPGSPVVCFTGDGALGFCLGEFDTLARHGLPVIVIVNNDHGWAMSQHGQDLIYGTGHRMISDLEASRYDQIASALGVHGELAETAEQVTDAIARALASGKPACINVLTKSSDIPAVTKRFVGDIADGPLDDQGRARVPYAEALAI